MGAPLAPGGYPPSAAGPVKPEGTPPGDRVDAALRVSAEAGRVVLESGGETYRAEDIIGAMAGSLGALDAESYATLTGLMASCTDETGRSRAIIKRIRKRQMNLERIALVSALARDAVSGKLGLDEAERGLCEIETVGAYPAPWPAVGAALITGFFCLLFGGAWNDALVAAAIGLAMGRITSWFGGMRLSDFFINIVGGAFAATVAMIASSLGLCAQRDTVIIGAIMLLVPGFMIVNAIRDTIAGDLVAGMARLADAFISATGISIGVGVALKVWALVAGAAP